MKEGRRLLVISCLAALTLVVIATFSLACASTEPTPTPQPPAQPAPPVAPTASSPHPTATQAVSAPTAAVPPTAIPTRALPTATPIPSGGPKYGGTIRFAHLLHVDTMDPAYNSLAGMYQVANALYEPLFRMTADSTLAPGLAEAWQFSADGKVITMNLRKGVKFHDGTAFNAQAVKWNFDRFMDPKENSPRRADLQPYVEKMEVVDDSTMRLYLTNPYRPFLPQVGSDRVGWLVSPAAVQKYGGGINGNFGRNPVGTGPFIFKDWVPDGYIRLLKNPDYWEKGKPYLDEIYMQGVKDNTVRVAMLRTNETDIIYNAEVRAIDSPLIKRDPNLKVADLHGSSTAILHFNASKAPFDNKALRQAVSYGINRQQFVDVVLGGAGDPRSTLIAAGWASSLDLKPVSYDAQIAKQKLAEAGYSSGVTISMGCPPSGVYADQCEFTQAMLKPIGINVDIKVIDATGYFLMTDQGYFRNPGFGTSRWAHRVDPHQLNQALFHKDGFKVIGTYSNTQLNNLIDQAATIYDIAKAKPMYDQIQTIAAQEALAPTLGWINAFQPMRKNVQGYIAYPTVFEHLEFLWLDK